MSDGGATTAIAADRLGVSARHVRRLVREKRLEVAGDGQARRITWESIERYRAERKVDISPDMSLRCPPDSGYGLAVVKLIQTVPPLSQPRSAARRLGIPAGQFEQLVKAGHIPVLLIGREPFVPGRWLSEMLAKAGGVTNTKRGSE